LNIVFENKNGFSTLKHIPKILSGEEENNELNEDLEELSSDDTVYIFNINLSYQ